MVNGHGNLTHSIRLTFNIILRSRRSSQTQTQTQSHVKRVKVVMIKIAGKPPAIYDRTYSHFHQFLTTHSHHSLHNTNTTLVSFILIRFQKYMQMKYDISPISIATQLSRHCEEKRHQSILPLNAPISKSVSECIVG